MRPLSPAHLAAAYDGAGELSISWVRRSRLAWSWQDEIEEPIDGEDHGFRVKLIGVGTLIERDVAEPSATFDAAELAILGAGPLSIEVRQIGSIALSRPAILNISA